MIIGLYGDSRAGKDSVAKVLVEDYGFEQRNMATAIRKMMLHIDPLLETVDYEPVPLSLLYEDFKGDWDLIKSESPDSVEFMINLGQAARDIIGEDVWLEVALKNPPEKLVIADVRQPNEYQRIKSLGGQVWKITRPGTKRRGMDGLLDGYEFDAHIDNRFKRTDLRGQVQATYSSQVHGAYIQKVEL